MYRSIFSIYTVFCYFCSQKYKIVSGYIEIRLRILSGKKDFHIIKVVDFIRNKYYRIDMELQKTNYKNDELKVEINCYVDKKNEIWFRGKEIAFDTGIQRYKKSNPR